MIKLRRQFVAYPDKTGPDYSLVSPQTHKIITNNNNILAICNAYKFLIKPTL